MAERSRTYCSDLRDLRERGLPIRGVPRRAVIAADGFECPAGVAAALARFHEAVAEFLLLLGDYLFLCRNLVEVGGRALGSTLRSKGHRHPAPARS